MSEAAVMLKKLREAMPALDKATQPGKGGELAGKGIGVKDQLAMDGDEKLRMSIGGKEPNPQFPEELRQADKDSTGSSTGDKKDHDAAMKSLNILAKRLDDTARKEDDA